MSRDASRLLEDMRRSKAKWKRRDIVTLYEAHGFIVQSRSKHDKVWHPDFPQLVTFLPRHKKILVAYVVEAVKLVDRLNRLKAQEGEP